MKDKIFVTKKGGFIRSTTLVYGYLASTGKARVQLNSNDNAILTIDEDDYFAMLKAFDAVAEDSEMNAQLHSEKNADKASAQKQAPAEVVMPKIEYMTDEEMRQALMNYCGSRKRCEENIWAGEAQCPLYYWCEDNTGKATKANHDELVEGCNLAKINIVKEGAEK